MSISSEPFAVADHRLLLAMVKIGKAPQVVYDIGASSGCWSQIVSEGMPLAAYHLFEPLSDHPSYRDSLANELRKHPNWHLHRVALGDTNGTTTMRVGGVVGVTGSTLLDVGQDPTYDYKPNVNQVRLDDYVAKNRLPLPNLVKMDTQGSENIILVGGKQAISAADVLIIETWFFRSYGPSTPLISEIIQLVSEMGFFPFDYGDHYRDPEGKILNLDLFFAKPPIAKSLAQLPH